MRVVLCFLQFIFTITTFFQFFLGLLSRFFLILSCKLYLYTKRAEWHFLGYVQKSDQIDNTNKPQLVEIFDSLLNHEFNYGNSSKAEHWRLMERSQGTDNGHTWRSMQEKCMCGISNRHQQLREYSICTYCTVLYWFKWPTLQQSWIITPAHSSL